MLIKGVTKHMGGVFFTAWRGVGTMEFTGDWRWHGTVSTKRCTIAWKGHLRMNAGMVVQYDMNEDH
jgi:hypothetical protein